MMRQAAQRRAREEREEAEQRRLASEAFQAHLARQPAQCDFPPFAQEATGFAGLGQFLQEMQRRH